ncbi:MAG: hypothetical protein M3016_08800 [Actinomycetota bacterium]|nr:hypothetical protein [Actinomycetota bacterium]
MVVLTHIARGRLGALALCLVLAACGSNSSPSASQDVAQVKATLTRAFRALAAGDGATVCSLATPQGRKSLATALPHSSCVRVIMVVAAHLRPPQKAALSSLQVKKATVSGRHAIVKDSDLSSARGSLKGFIRATAPPTQLTKQADGSWKISG